MVGFGCRVLGWVQERKGIDHCWWTSARSNCKQIFSGLRIWCGFGFSFGLSLGFGVGVGVWGMGCACLGIRAGFPSVARVSVRSNCA